MTEFNPEFEQYILDLRKQMQEGSTKFLSLRDVFPDLADALEKSKPLDNDFAAVLQDDIWDLV